MRLFPVLCLTLLLATPAFAQNNDMRALMNRMDQVQRQMDTVSQQVYKGSPPDAALSKPASSDNAGLAAAMDDRMNSIEGSMRQINGRLDDQDHAVGELQRQFDLYKSDMEVRLKDLSTQSPATAPQASAAPDDVTPRSAPIDTNAATAALAASAIATNTTDATGEGSALPSDNAAALYDSSFQALREQKYDRAEAGFKEFLQKYNTDALAGNAQYWLGETYYVRNNFTDAAKVFAQGYAKYPKSSKAPDNLLKLGLSLAQGGKKPEACATFQQLGTQYPNAAGVIKQRAADEQKKLACS